MFDDGLKIISVSFFKFFVVDFSLLSYESVSFAFKLMCNFILILY